MENISVAVADNIVDKELLFEIIYSLINEEDYNEVLKLKIVNVLENVSQKESPFSLGVDFYRDML
jgi:death-on-curing protein